MSFVIKVLNLGLSSSLTEQLHANLKQVTIESCTSGSELSKLLTSDELHGYHGVFVGFGFKELPYEELAQALRMKAPALPLFFLCDNADKFDRTGLVKNGFSEVFLLPLDNSIFASRMVQFVRDAEHGVFSPVHLDELEPGSTVDFQVSLLLPANNRYVTYFTPGDVVDPVRMERLRSHKVKSVFVPHDHLSRYYDYSASKLKELAHGGGQLSDDERQEKLRHHVRELVTGMLSESFSRHLGHGKKIVDHTRSIVNQYIVINSPGDWYKRVKSEVGKEGDAYSHGGSVATYAALFGMFIKGVKSEDLAVAAMFHDFGISKLPAEIQSKPVHTLTKEEMQVYQTHPLLSVEAMQVRKIAVPESVIKAVAQHHERWDGSGYPKAIYGPQIRDESQILAIADQFDYLTRVEDNLAPLSPDQALKKIELDKIGSPDLIRKLRSIYEKEQKAAS